MKKAHKLWVGPPILCRETLNTNPAVVGKNKKSHTRSTFSDPVFLLVWNVCSQPPCRNSLAASPPLSRWLFQYYLFLVIWGKEDLLLIYTYVRSSRCGLLPGSGTCSLYSFFLPTTSQCAVSGARWLLGGSAGRDTTPFTWTGTVSTDPSLIYKVPLPNPGRADDTDFTGQLLKNN